MHVLNVGAPLGRSALHEFVHLVSLASNQGNGEIPIWLWEAVAIFESKRPPPPNPVNLACISQNSIPSLQELSEHPSNIYRIGSLLAEFIVDTWGYSHLAELVETSGDISNTLEISETEFQILWLVYVISHYDIPESEISVSQQC